MAKKKESNHRVFDERVRDFLEDFSKEALEVRNSIVNALPAYNALLSLNASTFEEFALQWWAEKQGIDDTSETMPLPECPYCNSAEHVGTKGKKLYRCLSCNRSFAVNYNSIASGMKTDALTWMKVLKCMLEYMGMAKTCEYCGIANTTYYNIRNRLFYAMRVLLEEVRLYGLIQVDNTFVRSSYKGMSLKECEFEEDSIFFDPKHKPREARKRGSAYSHIDLNANSICIFTAIDDSGHVLARFTGIGASNYASLLYYVPEEKYLAVVPKEDPFRYLKKQQKERQCVQNESSLMIADKEKAIEKYASKIGIDIETHVFRRNGKQIRLPEHKHDIQRVNALHKRLKEFLQRHNHVSTKYLPGYLTLFEFIENTGASEKAIRRLFQILATPNFDKPSKFFDELFSVPNYLEEWLIGESRAQSEGLSNGDEITVKITTSGVAAEKIKSIELTYVVEGLEEIETVDVFSNIAVTFSGVSGNGTLKYELLSDDNILNSCTFKISHNDDLKNGDTVTLTITNTSFIFDKYKVVPIQTSKEYTVYSLSEWANKDSIPLSLFQEFANSFVSEENEENAQSSGGGFTYTEAKLFGIYYLSKKEDVVFGSANEIHIIVCYDRYFGGERDMTIYVPLRFENLVLDSEGKVNVDYEEGKRSAFFHTDIDKYFDNYENDYYIEKLD